MRALIKGIAYNFKTQPIGSATNGLYYGSAPQGTPYPFVTLSEITDEPQDTMNTKNDSLRYQFSIVADGETPDGVERIYALLKEAFDDVRFLIAGNSILICKRGVATLARDPEQKFWQKTCDYIFEVQHNA